MTKSKSPNTILKSINTTNIRNWISIEISVLNIDIQDVTMKVFDNLSSFCEFPKDKILLWNGCIRSSKFHNYPLKIKNKKPSGIKIDTRSNGPANVSFLWAHGSRPARFGSNNKWSVHHMYDGKFPYVGKSITLHAVKEPLHFTQSAGLVALHPIADALADEIPAFAWYLRYMSYKKFGYDPDNVFCKSINKYGFKMSSGLPTIIYP